MATTLWDKFKFAIRWVRGTTDAAVAVLQAAPANQTPYKLLDAVGSDNNAPSADTDGVDVEGVGTLQFYWRHATSGQTSEVTLFFYDADPNEASDADRWFRWGTLSLDADEGIADPFDLEGHWTRVYAQLTTAPGDTVTLKVAPHNG
ncbi:MAG: hypothetical protein U5L04_02695 [Trueperaceae bacterium]|nr:hypothetical protein [Trueperaceae bacterium]